jgi:hypothetical protein
MLVSNSVSSETIKKQLTKRLVSSWYTRCSDFEHLVFGDVANLIL